MKAPFVSRSVKLTLAAIEKGVYPIWNRKLEKFQIFWKDPQSRVTRYLLTVENEDGSFRPLDSRALLWVSQNIGWDILHQYPTPAQSYRRMKDLKAEKYRQDKNKMEDKRIYSKKHYRRDLKAALRNAQGGIFGPGPQLRKKKIFSIPSWAKSHMNKKQGEIVLA